MSEVWAVIVGVILLLIIYGIISSKISDRKRKKIREKSIPIVEDNIRVGLKYNIQLNDGKRFLAVEILGSSTTEEGHYTFAGWEGMLVLRQETGKRVFLKQSSIRFVEEV